MCNRNLLVSYDLQVLQAQLCNFFSRRDHPFRPQNGRFRPPKRVFSHRNMGLFASRYGPYRIAKRPVSQNRGLFFAKRRGKNRIPFSISAGNEVLKFRLSAIPDHPVPAFVLLNVRKFPNAPIFEYPKSVSRPLWREYNLANCGHSFFLFPRHKNHDFHLILQARTSNSRTAKRTTKTQDTMNKEANELTTARLVLATGARPTPRHCSAWRPTLPSGWPPDGRPTALKPRAGK